MTRPYDVIVVGLGGMGISVAFHLPGQGVLCSSIPLSKRLFPSRAHQVRQS